MGFTTGFTGGVTLTLGVAYLTVLAHQRNRQRQSDILRVNARVLNDLADGAGVLAAKPPAPDAARAPLPTREELAAARRAHLVEDAKDRWNAEVAGAVRWAQGTDWAAAREAAEAAAARLWRGTGAADAAGRAEARAGEALRGAAARGAAAEEAAAGALRRGYEAGRDAAGRARAAAGLAGERLEARVEARLSGADAGPGSDVERALARRYEGPDNAAMQRSVGELLSERYPALGGGDGTKVRGG